VEPPRGHARLPSLARSRPSSTPHVIWSTTPDRQDKSRRWGRYRSRADREPRELAAEGSDVGVRRALVHGAEHARPQQRPRSTPVSLGPAARRPRAVRCRRSLPQDLCWTPADLIHRFAGQSSTPVGACNAANAATASTRRPLDTVVETDRACGGDALVPRKVLERVRVFDPSPLRTARTRTSRCGPAPGTALPRSRSRVPRFRQPRAAGASDRALLRPAKRPRHRGAARAPGRGWHPAAALVVLSAHLAQAAWQPAARVPRGRVAGMWDFRAGRLGPRAGV
jgi:hypothetical protein